MNKTKLTREALCSIIVIALTILGILLFALGFSTGYYTFGQLNSKAVLAASIAAALVACAALLLRQKLDKQWWPKLLGFCVTALLAYAAMTLIGDRVEGIGICILTDYDSGHGGEEAIYMSLGASVAWLAAMVFNIIGSFGADEPVSKSGKVGLSAAGAILLAAILIPSLALGGVFAPKASAPGGAGGGTALTGTYTTTFSGAEGNVDLVQDYQFQCGNLLGLMNYDTRLNLTLTLTLKEDGTYALSSDAYCIEAGKRAEIGDETGLGMISTMNAEGTYTVNEDGTVTTSPATHAVFELALDTYSSQMRGPAQYKIGDLDADGTYDSAEHPAVLDAVPEATWTLGADMSIAAYQVAAAEEEPEKTEEPTAAPEGVTITSDDGGTTMTFSPDGSYRFFFEAYGIEDLGTYTYEDGVLTLTDANGAQTTAEGDPMKLHYVYSQSDQLTGDYTIPASTFDFPAAPAVEGVEIVSDDGGTTMTFYPTGTYQFDFAAYGISDAGTYTYVDGVLTLTDVNGVEYTAEGDPLKLHYGYSGAPDQLTGEYTIPAEALAFQAGEELKGLTVVSDDRGTTISFLSDGSYRFFFEAYQIEDLGLWQIADGILSLTDANGKEIRAEGAPYKLHYVYSQSEQLTGDYTIPAGVFPFSVSGTSIPSDDLGTNISFFEDGTYLFTFDSYGILDAGTWTFEKGVLTLTDVNGVQYTADGETLHLHYGYSGAPDQLTGDYSIDPAIFG